MLATKLEIYQHMDLSILSRNKVSLMTLDEKYLPTAIVLTFEGHGIKVNVMPAIDMMIESLKRIILDDSDEKLILPIVLPIESMEGITE